MSLEQLRKDALEAASRVARDPDSVLYWAKTYFSFLIGALDHHTLTAETTGQSTDAAAQALWTEAERTHAANHAARNRTDADGYENGN